jgi:hypothetical protein
MNHDTLPPISTAGSKRIDPLTLGGKIMNTTTNKTVLSSSVAAAVLAISGCAEHGENQCCSTGGGGMTGSGPCVVASESVAD